jgi:hypothetical protein
MDVLQPKRVDFWGYLGQKNHWYRSHHLAGTSWDYTGYYGNVVIKLD